MAVYEVFSHPELRRYKTNVCSKASILLVIILFLTVIPPLFVVYRSYGFWIKETYYREVPTVLFKKQLLLVLELEGGQNSITYSTFQRYNQMQQQNLRIPLIQSREEDNDRDGKADGLIFKLEMPLQDTENVLGVKLFLFFDYRLFRFSTFGMESMAYIHHQSPIPGARYENSIINSTSVYAESYQLSSIFKEYAGRNVTTILDAPYSAWLSGRGAGQPFVVSANISYIQDEY
ncbi:hypothetical protein KUTeg_019640, partial [Tegillarca granosa]